MSDVECFRKMSDEIDDLYDFGDRAKGEALLSKAIEASKENKAYHLYFNAEYACYEHENYVEQEAMLREALKLEKEDYFLQRALGVCLSLQEKTEKAIEMFDKSLLNKEDDYDALRQKAVCLVKRGDYKEAIKWFDKALEINPADYRSLQQKAVAYTREKNLDDALRLFEQAIEINPYDLSTYINQGLTFLIRAVETSNEEDFDRALASVNKALEKKPTDANMLRYKRIIEQRKRKWEREGGTQAKADASTPYQSAGGRDVPQDSWRKMPIPGDGRREDLPSVTLRLGKVIERVLMTMLPEKNEFEKFKKDAEESLHSFLDIPSAKKRKYPEPFHKSRSFFMGLRKWNSYTPSLPDASDSSVGGGYFLFYKGVGIAIDPGFNFLENFHRTGGRLTHINNIVITHAHNDHTNDLESLLSLLYKRNKTTGAGSAHRVKLYLNAGTFKKYSGFLDLRNADYIENVMVMGAGDRYELCKGLRLRVLPAFHDEVVAERYSVGLLFDMQLSGGGKKEILFTGDTGLCRTDKNAEGKNLLDSANEIWDGYWKTFSDLTEISWRPDILVPHLGSLHKNELDPKKYGPHKNQKKAQSAVEPQKSIFYKDHLGVHGVVRLMTVLKPRVTLISEFGEELKEFLPKLMDLIVACAHGLGEKKTDEEKKDMCILPCALQLLYDLETDSIYSIISNQFEKVSELDFNYTGSPDYNFYYYLKNSQRAACRHTQGFKELADKLKAGEIFHEEYIFPAS